MDNNIELLDDFWNPTNVEFSTTEPPTVDDLFFKLNAKLSKVGNYQSSWKKPDYLKHEDGVYGPGERNSVMVLIMTFRKKEPTLPHEVIMNIIRFFDDFIATTNFKFSVASCQAVVYFCIRRVLEVSECLTDERRRNYLNSLENLYPGIFEHYLDFESVRLLKKIPVVSLVDNNSLLAKAYLATGRELTPEASVKLQVVYYLIEVIYSFNAAFIEQHSMSATTMSVIALMGFSLGCPIMQQASAIINSELKIVVTKDMVLSLKRWFANICRSELFLNHTPQFKSEIALFVDLLVGDSKVRPTCYKCKSIMNLPHCFICLTCKTHPPLHLQ